MSARLTDRDRALRQITERQWQSTVEGMLTAHGWRWYHPSDNRPITARSGRKYVQNVRAGFPDLIAVRVGRLLAVELKTETGKASPDQLAWLADLEAVGAECHVWRPRDADRIAQTLA